MIQEEKRFEQSAYHESGHVVMTYFAGYSCDEVELLLDEPGNAKTTMNYGEDLLLITAITNSMTDPYIFNGLPREIKANSVPVANGIAMIYLLAQLQNLYS